MKYFNVTIINKGAKSVEIIKAPAKMSAVANAKRKFPGAVIVRAVETAAPVEDSFQDIIKKINDWMEGEIPEEAKISSIRQIAVMSDAGIPINDTLQEIANTVENEKLKKIYQSLCDDINAGKSMSSSMEKYRSEFGNITIAMTDLGEKTGNISEAYSKLASILEDIADNQKKFKKALKGPKNTLIAMGVAFSILILAVVPKFKAIFEKLKTDLPVPTQILLFLEHFMTTYMTEIIITFIVVKQVHSYLYKNNEAYTLQVDTIMINPRVILVSKAIFLSTMHRYNLVFGELVKSGTPVVEALDTAVKMVDNLAMKKKLSTIAPNISKGKSLTESLIETGLYQNMLLQMIKAGEAGGQLDMMLDKVTNYYYAEFTDLIDNLSAYIEPIMMFFIACLVTLMALGIFMPMWDMGKAAK
ncbi:Type II secretion system protein [hydrothermal vent metagenome]|uniref:Type II secretion system protein n=1 Tax=hydrothermal vent metagenome TaxID=652676 RepID=A0A1W1EK87_9ZZZZ